jgi:polysaccharide pyruvyl transferase WcaK-like protein
MRGRSPRTCWNTPLGRIQARVQSRAELPTLATRRIPTECVSWRGHGNLGDELIFAAQEAMFGPVLDLGQYMAAPEAVLVGGGTFVPKFPEHPDLVALSRRLPTMFFGTGIGDPLFWGTDYIADWLEIVGNARFIGVRGPLSKERLESWGVPGGRVEWVGDPALYFARTEAGQHRVKGELAVNLGITLGNLYGFDEERVEQVVIGCLKELARAGWRITLVCAWPEDDVAVDRIKAEVSVRAVEHWHEDFAGALASVSKFDVMLSEKLHVGVVAACRAVPFVALNYRSKVLDFCRSVGWERFCVSTDNPDPDEILELIASLAGARDAHSAKLAQGVSATRARLLGALRRAVSALLGGTR